MAQKDYLIPFELEDQFERSYTHKDYIGSIFIVFGSDADGSDYNGLWGEAIANALKDKPVYSQMKTAGLADLNSVPFFLKGMIRNKFPEDREQWVLMDWNGDFDEAYTFEAGSCNILVFDHEGQLIYKAGVKELDSSKLTAITNKIIELKR